MSQMRFPTPAVSRETAFGRLTINADGSRELPNVAVYGFMAGQPTVDGHPPHIAATLADYEDEDGLVPAQRS